MITIRRFSSSANGADVRVIADPIREPISIELNGLTVLELSRHDVLRLSELLLIAAFAPERFAALGRSIPGIHRERFGGEKPRLSLYLD